MLGQGRHFCSGLRLQGMRWRRRETVLQVVMRWRANLRNPDLNKIVVQEPIGLSKTNIRDDLDHLRDRRDRDRGSIRH